MMQAVSVFRGDSSAAYANSGRRFFNLYSSASFDGDFTSGVILYDGGDWSDLTSLRFVRLQSALVAEQLDNFRKFENGGGGTPVSLRPCLSPLDAVEILESEVER